METTSPQYIHVRCPHCKAPVVKMDLDAAGNARCANGHVFPSAAPDSSRAPRPSLVWSCGVPGHEHATEDEAWICIHEHLG